MNRLLLSTRLANFLFLIGISFIFSNFSIAVTKTSVAPGAWSTGGTWSPSGAPSTGDDVVIAAGHTVTLAPTITLRSLIIENGAKLTQSNTTITLNVSGILAYKNDGEHAITNSLLKLDCNALTDIDGTGIFSGSAAGIMSVTGGPHFLSTCTLTMNSLLTSVSATANTCMFQNDGNITVNGAFRQSVDGLTVINNGTISQVGSSRTTSFYNNTMFINTGTFSTTGNLVLHDGGQFYNYGTATITGNVLGTTGTVGVFAQAENAVVQFGGSVFPVATSNDGELAIVGWGENPPNTVEYNGTDQIIKTPSSSTLGATAGAYHHLILSNSGTKTMEGNLSIMGDLTIQNSAILDVSATPYSLDLYGNFVNTSDDIDPFLEQTGTVTFKGSTAQSISSSLTGGEIFYDLKIQNSSTGITLTDNTINVSNTLDLTAGKINTGAYECVVTNTSTSSIINHSTSSYVNGYLRRYLNSVGSYDFPVGNTNSYQLGTLNFSAGSTVDNILGYFSNGATGSGLPLVESSITYSDLLHCGGVSSGTGNGQAGFWTFTPNSGTATYGVTLNARNYSTVGTHNTIVKRANSGSAWQLLGTAGSESGSEPLIVTRTNYSGFSDFAIVMDAITPLDVELTDFTVKCTKSKANEAQIGATINWTTEIEKNNDHFTLERSEDGFDWSTVSKIPGGGTKFETTTYTYYEEFMNPTPQIDKDMYYRLSQTDTDGKITLFKTIGCRSEASPKIQLFPVPATESVIVSFGDRNNVPNSFIVTDMFGKLIEEIDIEEIGITWYKLDISQYSTGKYQIQINGWVKPESTVFIKQ